MQPHPVTASVDRLLEARILCHRRQPPMTEEKRGSSLADKRRLLDPHCRDIFDGCKPAVADPPFKRNTIQRIDDAVQPQERHSGVNPQQRAHCPICLDDLQALDGITDQNSMFLGKHCELVRILQFCAFKTAEARSSERDLFEQKRPLVIPNLLTPADELRFLQFEPFLLLASGAFNRGAEKLKRERYRSVIFSA